MQYSQKQLYERRDHWLTSLRPNHDRWWATELLHDLQDEYHELMVAACLENQRLINEVELGKVALAEKNWLALFTRLSIPLVRRVYGNAPFVSWVGLQAKLSPNDSLWLLQNGILDNYPNTSKTKVLNTPWPVYDEDEAHKYTAKISYEFTLVETATIGLCDELSREVIQDLDKVSPHLSFTIDEIESQAETIMRAIENMAKYLMQNVGTATWLITSPDFIDEFKSDNLHYKFTEASSPDLKAGVRLVGNLDGIAVYCDDELPSNKVILGRRGKSWLETGYYYMPYIPFSVLPVQLDPNTLKPRHRMMTRYGKVLAKGGEQHYRVLEFENVVFPQERDSFEEIGNLGPGTVIVLQKRELDEDSPDQPLEQLGSTELVREDEPESELSCVDSLCEGAAAESGPGDSAGTPEP